MKYSSIMSTILGALVSVAIALQVIDFNNFDLKKEWIKIVLISLVAIGGYMTKIKNINDN